MANYAVAFPIAGGVGLVAMVFAARRYCTMSLLLSFFAMLMFQADYTFSCTIFWAACWPPGW